MNEWRLTMRKVPDVGCEGDDGLLRIHPETERCEVCAAAPASTANPGWCAGCSPDNCMGCMPGGAAMSATSETKAALPVIHALFETTDGCLTGTGSAPVKRVEAQDDGAFTVVIDHWPMPAASAPIAAPWTDAQLRGIASDFFPDSKDWPAAIQCLRQLLLVQAKASSRAEAAAPHGCHCDLDPGETPDGCVLDAGRPQDCTRTASGRVTAKEQCSEWRPIVSVRAAPAPQVSSEAGASR